MKTFAYYQIHRPTGRVWLKTATFPSRHAFNVKVGWWNLLAERYAAAEHSWAYVPLPDLVVLSA